MGSGGRWFSLRAKAKAISASSLNRDAQNRCDRRDGDVYAAICLEASRKLQAALEGRLERINMTISLGSRLKTSVSPSSAPWMPIYKVLGSESAYRFSVLVLLSLGTNRRSQEGFNRHSYWNKQCVLIFPRDTE